MFHKLKKNFQSFSDHHLNPLLQHTHTHAHTHTCMHMHTHVYVHTDYTITCAFKEQAILHSSIGKWRIKQFKFKYELEKHFRALW